MTKARFLQQHPCASIYWLMTVVESSFFKIARAVLSILLITVLSQLLSIAAARADHAPELLFPTQASDVNGQTALFEWTGHGANMDYWALWIGSTFGGQDLYKRTLTATSVSISNLPTDGSTLYVRLYGKSSGTWELFSDYSFTSVDNAQPELISPAPDSLLYESSTTLEWTDNGLPITKWALWAGTAPGGRDLYNRVETGTSATLSNLPQDGSSIYVRLYSFSQGSWTLVDSRDLISVENARPELLYPSNGDVLGAASVTFNWTDNDTSVDTWALWIGDSPGGRQILSHVIDGTSYTLNNLPVDGSNLYVRLHAFRQGKWDLIDDVSVSSATIDLSQITSHSNGDTLTSSTDAFTWATEDQEVNTWALWFGTTPGSRDIQFRTISGNSAPITNLPTTGEPLFLSLYALRNGKWVLEDAHEYIAALQVPPIPVNLDEYDLTFGDEFNGTELDTDKWATSYLWGPFATINAEEQYYVDSGVTDSNATWSPFYVNDGVLTISAIPTDSVHTASEQPDQNSTFWQQNPEYQYNENYDPADANYLSGVIASHKTYSFTHGYVESRVKVPAGKGLWSAFWLHTFKFVEEVPEIDIMEHLGEPANVVHQTMHYFDVEDNWRLVSTPTNSVSNTDYSQAFHTYSVSWEPKKVDFFVDGELVLSVPDTNFKIAKQAMHVIANLAVGGSWPGSPDSSTPFPAKLAIDYIRVYQKKSLGTLTDAKLSAEYELMFSDEFNGTQLDSNKWNTSYLWGPFYQINNEEQYYPDVLGRDDQFTDSTIDVSDGTLKLNAHEVAPFELPVQPPLNDPYWADNPQHQYNLSYADTNGWIPQYTSGLITSYDSFKFVHGYAEASMKIPEGSGLWPAFWLLNGYYVGPQPEIDIMEARGGSTHEVHQSYHYNNTSGQLISQTNATADLTQGVKYSDSFHRYGVEWRPGSIEWYIDGEIVHSVSGPEVSLQLAYLIANLAVGGNYVNAVDPSALPATLEIDYIKVWQRQ